MKTFNDLKFKPHTSGEGKMASMIFGNGYGISVVRFKFGMMGGSYTSDETDWEVAVVKGNKEGFSLCYDTPITNDVIGYLSEQKVTNIMKEIQQLPKE